MRIRPSNTVQNAKRTGAASRAKSSQGAVFTVPTETPETAASSSEVSSTGPVVALSPLLALQETPDATSAPARQVRRASELLRDLDQIRLGLLAGGIPRQALVRLARDLKAQREAVADPRLRSVLDEIELRARVELAKYELASESRDGS